MENIQLASGIDLERVIQGMGKLNNAELEKVLSRLSILLAQRKSPSLPARESDLLHKINQGLPAHILLRHTFLTGRLQANALTEAEHNELIGLIDQIEQADAERMQAIAELSSLRAISVDTLMRQLDIHPSQPQLSRV